MYKMAIIYNLNALFKQNPLCVVPDYQQHLNKLFIWMLFTALYQPSRPTLKNSNSNVSHESLNKQTQKTLLKSALT